MSGTLNPTLAVAISIKTSIVTNMQMDVSGAVRAEMIAPLLTVLCKWETQIPLMLEGTGPSASANLVFAIRKELFQPPSFAQSTLGISLADLPAAFQEFVAFIQKVQEVQRADKEKVAVKARISFYPCVLSD
jgi:hypothetical protein